MAGSSGSFSLFDSDSKNVYKDTSSHGGGGRSSGCYVGILAGFILAFLAILSIVGVAVIVYFAVPGRDVVCQCEYPGVANPTVDSGAALAQCQEWAEDGRPEICKLPIKVVILAKYACPHPPTHRTPTQLLSTADGYVTIKS